MTSLLSPYYSLFSVLLNAHRLSMCGSIQSHKRMGLNKQHICVVGEERNSVRQQAHSDPPEVYSGIIASFHLSDVFISLGLFAGELCDTRLKPGLPAGRESCVFTACRSASRPPDPIGDLPPHNRLTAPSSHGSEECGVMKDIIPHTVWSAISLGYYSKMQHFGCDGKMRLGDQSCCCCSLFIRL